ncbi:SAP30-binding protein [Coccinella septempunctata]|uniref:SAP30-binding protein n=1 Tax=Coccinella septempunctata TaxID=41139 RepID=UPI001D07D3EB|nr:SAP30-binding protein [Coccinella septempunctata]
MSNSTALASLTATYTDSEGEEDRSDEDNEQNNGENKNGSPYSQVTSLPSSPTVAPVRVTSKVAKLVCYHDDTVVSEDENEVDETAPAHEVILLTDENPNPEEELTEDGVSIPPEPPGNCSVDLQDKIAKYYDKMKNEKLDMNAFIEKRKDFRNPSIYEKLLQFCAINELGTNYPPSIYDPLKWSKESYYEELAKVQKAEIEKREKERKSKDFSIGGLKKEDESRKRKSKWDQPGGNNPASIRPAGLVQPPTLTTSATGTKSTVISAFGSLPKKPRP